MPGAAMFIANFALALILALQHDMSTHLQLQQHRDFFSTVGIPSSRRIERACYEDLAFQVLSMSCFCSGSVLDELDGTRRCCSG
jgi:hypothetical protein